MTRKRRRKRSAPRCPECKWNRPYRGGPCPPCLRRLGREAPPAHEGPPRAVPYAMTYAERNDFIRSLGFESYAAYLASDLWAGIRRRVLKKSRRCWVCKRRRRAKQVHHERYTEANLKGESLAGLRPICPGCHLLIEFDWKTGRKLSHQTYPPSQRTRWPRSIAWLLAMTRNGNARLALREWPGRRRNLERAPKDSRGLGRQSVPGSTTRPVA